MKHVIASPRTRAFTLVELLVVIGIIAVLVSILLPALNVVRQQAATLQCSAQMRQIGFAWIQYQNDNKGWVAPMSRHWCDGWANNMNDNTSFHYNSTSPDPVSEPEYRWFHYLNRFVKNYSIFNCPTANLQVNTGSTGFETQVKQSGGDGTPSNIGRGYSAVGLSSNYSYAARLLPRWELPGLPPAGTGSPKSVPPFVANDPGYFADFGPKKFTTVLSYIRRGGGTTSNGVIVMDGAWWVVDTSTGLDGLNYSRRYIHYKQRANALFADGHVDTFLRPQFKAVFVDHAMVITTQ
jgi:prepilin-type N-terminal cleavage/methylation domain-containing protein/prepilin-type processing-associated H-X9-DG protein